MKSNRFLFSIILQGLAFTGAAYKIPPSSLDISKLVIGSIGLFVVIYIISWLFFSDKEIDSMIKLIGGN